MVYFRELFPQSWGCFLLNFSKKIAGDLNSFNVFFPNLNGFKTTRYDIIGMIPHFHRHIVFVHCNLQLLPNPLFFTQNFHLIFSDEKTSPFIPPAKKQLLQNRHRECWELERHLDSDRSLVVRIDTNLWKDSLFPSDKNYDAQMKKDTPGKNERQTNPKVMEVRFRLRLFFFSIGWFWGSMLL